MSNADTIRELVLSSVSKWGGPKQVDKMLTALRGLKAQADIEGQHVYQSYIERVSRNAAGSQQMVAIMMLGMCTAMMFCEAEKARAQKN